MPGKKTINLKKFLTDFRTGASDAELMDRHGLDNRDLQKMWRVLAERQLVTPEDLKGKRISPEHREPPASADPVGHEGSESEPDASPTFSQEGQDSHSKCPQCGALVTEIMLTCPECGHVLPGETRWSRVQPEKTALHRVPPWLIGCFIALPIAIGMYVVFKQVLVPLTAASIHRRVQSVDKTTPPHGNPSPEPSGAQSAPLPIYEQVKQLTDQRFIQAVNADFTAFTVTERWYDLSRERKLALVTQLGTALIASGMTAPFELKDDSGIPGARVNLRTIELLDRYGFAETIQRSDAESSQLQPAEQGAPSRQATPDIAKTHQSGALENERPR